jgi:hypothetical protein
MVALETQFDSDGRRALTEGAPGERPDQTTLGLAVLLGALLMAGH